MRHSVHVYKENVKFSWKAAETQFLSEKLNLNILHVAKTVFI